uniref:Uncharacterized protein n=1 Tax=Lactuca sativa TaxID=4236 RepID=A0A9R1VXM1_LACSA|nr:hypothetical protein LSAT_V11C400212010 [Lactuca sativa]
MVRCTRLKKIGFQVIFVVFFCDMTTTGRSEIIFLLIIVSVDLVIEDVGHKQIHDSMLFKYQESHLRSLSPLKKHGYQIGLLKRLNIRLVKKWHKFYCQTLQSGSTTSGGIIRDTLSSHLKSSSP